VVAVVEVVEVGGGFVGLGEVAVGQQSPATTPDHLVDARRATRFEPKTRGRVFHGSATVVITGVIVSDLLPRAATRRGVPTVDRWECLGCGQSVQDHLHPYHECPRAEGGGDPPTCPLVSKHESASERSETAAGDHQCNTPQGHQPAPRIEVSGAGTQNGFDLMAS
jgi:hypothetical protein